MSDEDGPRIITVRICGVDTEVLNSWVDWVYALAGRPRGQESEPAVREWWARCEELHERYRRERDLLERMGR